MKIHARHIAVMAFFATTLVSCQFDAKGIRGSGNVVTQERNISEPFTGVDASGGIEVAISQGEQSVQVQADDNLQKHILTRVENGVLKISSDYNSYINVKSRKVIVKMPEVRLLESSSGVSMWSTSSIRSPQLKVRAKSGSEIKLMVEADILNCEASSGSSLTLTGKALEMHSSSGSGSTLDAAGLLANQIKAESGSGSTLKVHALISLDAEASSGSSIEYKGNPKKIRTDTGSGGSISKI